MAIHGTAQLRISGRQPYGVLPLYIIDRADAAGNRASLAGAASAHFAIGLDSEAERALCLLDRVHQPAEQVFELLTRHAVTPCHLTDVLEDMAAVS